MDYHRSKEEIFEEDRIEEMLELLWMAIEEGGATIDKITKRSEDPKAAYLLKDMESAGLISLNSGRITFRETGEKRAGEIIRRHRIAERLLSEVFEVEEKEIELHACELEHSHVLGQSVVNSICTFLGHPPTCPHGRPIPKGDCCRKFSLEVKPLVGSLTDLQVGEEVKIVFISTKYHARLDRLSSLGIIPGNIIKLHQKQPTYVIRIGETELALDSDLAKDIFVKKTS